MIVSRRVKPPDLMCGRTVPRGHRTYRCTAYHEAAHFVIGRLAGFDKTGATISGDGSGVTWTSYGQYYCDTSGILNSLMDLFAGRIADRRATTLGWDGANEDRRDAVRALAGLSRSKKKHLCAVAAMRTRGAVAAHWRTIDRVAKALMRHGSIEQFPNAIPTSRRWK